MDPLAKLAKRLLNLSYRELQDFSDMLLMNLGDIGVSEEVVAEALLLTAEEIV